MELETEEAALSPPPAVVGTTESSTLSPSDTDTHESLEGQGVCDDSSVCVKSGSLGTTEGGSLPRENLNTTDTLEADCIKSVCAKSGSLGTTEGRSLPRENLNTTDSVRGTLETECIKSVDKTTSKGASHALSPGKAVKGTATEASTPDSKSVKSTSIVIKRKRRTTNRTPRKAKLSSDPKTPPASKTDSEGKQMVAKPLPDQTGTPDAWEENIEEVGGKREEPDDDSPEYEVVMVSTPQMKEARRLARLKQLREMKAREEREARRDRALKRRGEASPSKVSLASDSPAKKKVCWREETDLVSVFKYAPTENTLDV